MVSNPSKETLVFGLVIIFEMEVMAQDHAFVDEMGIEAAYQMVTMVQGTLVSVIVVIFIFYQVIEVLETLVFLLEIVLQIEDVETFLALLIGVLVTFLALQTEGVGTFLALQTEGVEGEIFLALLIVDVEIFLGPQIICVEILHDPLITDEEIFLDLQIVGEPYLKNVFYHDPQIICVVIYLISLQLDLYLEEQNSALSLQDVLIDEELPQLRDDLDHYSGGLDHYNSDEFDHNHICYGEVHHDD